MKAQHKLWIEMYSIWTLHLTDFNFSEQILIPTVYAAADHDWRGVVRGLYLYRGRRGELIIRQYWHQSLRHLQSIASFQPARLDPPGAAATVKTRTVNAPSAASRFICVPFAGFFILFRIAQGWRLICSIGWVRAVRRWVLSSPAIREEYKRICPPHLCRCM